MYHLGVTLLRHMNLVKSIKIYSSAKIAKLIGFLSGAYRSTTSIFYYSIPSVLSAAAYTVGLLCRHYGISSFSTRTTTRHAESLFLCRPLGGLANQL